MLGIYVLHDAAWDSWMTGDTLLALEQTTTQALDRMAREIAEATAETVSVLEDQVQFQVPTDVDGDGDLIVNGTGEVELGPPVTYRRIGTQLIREGDGPSPVVLSSYVETFSAGFPDPNDPGTIELRLATQGITPKGRAVTYPGGGKQAVARVMLRTARSGTYTDSGVPSGEEPPPPPGRRRETLGGM
jgi:hypothetical protein